MVGGDLLLLLGDDLALAAGAADDTVGRLLEASQQARAKRLAQLESQKEAGEKAGESEDTSDTPDTSDTEGRHRAPEPAPTGARYGGTPPPADWTAPGWPPKDNPYASAGEHPGMKNYGPALAPQQGPEPERQPEAETEVIGFRLPDHERPEYGAERTEGQPEERPAPAADDVADPDHHKE